MPGFLDQQSFTPTSRRRSHLGGPGHLRVATLVSGWITLEQVCALWHCRPHFALRRVEKLVETGAVELREDRKALRLTWPAEIIASFGEITVDSRTES